MGLAHQVWPSELSGFAQAGMGRDGSWTAKGGPRQSSLRRLFGGEASSSIFSPSSKVQGRDAAQASSWRSLQAIITGDTKWQSVLHSPHRRPQPVHVASHSAIQGSGSGCNQPILADGRGGDRAQAESIPH
jgi:hypothetical protein